MKKISKQILCANSKEECIKAGTRLEDLPIFPQDIDEITSRLQKSECKTTILRDIAARRYDMSTCKHINSNSNKYNSYQWKLKLLGLGSMTDNNLLMGGFHSLPETDNQSIYSNLTDIINHTTNSFIHAQTFALDKVDNAVPDIILDAGENSEIIISVG
jgi:hypothetical protein